MKSRQLLGKPLASEVQREVKAAFASLPRPPRMVLVMASEDPASAVYVQSKVRQGKRLGAEVEVCDLGSGCSMTELTDKLSELSHDESVQGIVLEMPLAAHLDADRALGFIAPAKDIEGLSPANLALLAAEREDEALLPPTPHSVRRLLAEALELKGARVALVGPGRTVGRPLLWMLNNAGATVTVCNRYTENLGRALSGQDAVVVAVGRAGLIDAEHISAGQVLIDAGINVTEGGVVGDSTPAAGQKARAHTPVPGGVGPLTSALMFYNLMQALRLQGS